MADPTRVVRAIAGLFKPADEAAAAVKQAEPLTKSERLAKLAETERALPLRLARAPAKSKQEIASHAERVGRQMLGEHVRKPGQTVNLADRSMKESKRVQGLRYELEPTKVLPESVPYEPRIGDVNVAFPGDYTVSDVILKSIDDVPIGSVQQGGSRYGQGKLDMDNPLFWASNEVPAQLAQDKITDVAHLFEPERVLAHHLAMGPTATNFAQHFADANLRAIDYSKLSRKDMDLFNRIIAGGYDVKNKNTGKIESVTFPHWPGIEDPEAAYAAMKADPELRKWFNNRMKTPKVTEATNMPNGLDIQWAITHPELRNMEINLTGHSVGEMIPGAQLTGTAQHQTYSKGIQGKYLGHQGELTPFAISFPDAAQHIASTKRPSEFTGTIQKVFPHQIVDQQYLDELGEYERQLRKMILGKKNGGSVKDPQKQLDEMMAPLFAKGGKVEKSPQQQLDEMLAPLMGRSEEIKPLQWKADGGAMKVREPAIKRMKWRGTAPMKMAQGGVPSLGPASEHMMPDPTDSGATRFEPGYAEGGAAFGVFPQMKRKRSKQDPEAAKNVPVDVARGIVSGVLGAPGDIESLIRMLPGLSEKTVLPTSEDIEKRLPLRSESPVSQAASGLGQLAGGFYTGPGSPLRLIGGLPSAVKRAGKEFVEAAGQTVSPLTVYHGSPHKFEKFDSSKIGSGEGAQAYGHGLYFAESPGVAQSYRESLSKNVTVDGSKLQSIPSDSPLAEAHNMVVRNIQNGMKPEEAISATQKYWTDAANEMQSFAKSHPELADRIQKEALSRMQVSDAAKALKPESFHLDPGHLYTVDLPDEKIARMLDWDKPLSKQDEVSDAWVKSKFRDIAEGEGLPYQYTKASNFAERTGQDLYNALIQKLGSPEAATQVLRSYGIPGIKYLDEGSRGASGTGKWLITMKNGEQKVYDFKPNDDVLQQIGATAEPTGTRNFVVFPGEEEVLTILERKKKGGPIDKSRQAKLMSEIKAKMNGRKRTQEVTYGY